MQNLVAGAELDNWCKTGSRCIGGYCFRVGSCCCRTGNCWCNTGSCWCREVVASVGLVPVGAGRWSLVQEGSCCCREVVDGVELVVAAAGRWSPVKDW